MPEFVRVAHADLPDREYTISANAVRDHHRVIKGADAVDRNGRPLRPTFKTPAKKAAPASTPATNTKSEE